MDIGELINRNNFLDNTKTEVKNMKLLYFHYTFIQKRSGTDFQNKTALDALSQVDREHLEC